jgi:hypothetical protein
MKKIILIIAIAMTIVSCSKQKDEIVIQPTVKPTGSFIFRNETKDVYRVELWRNNSGGQPPVFYTILPSQSMVVANSVAGKYVIGILQMSGYTSQDDRTDYGFSTILQADCFFEYVIQ